ncbi:iron chelate uptake ABC transporter family permease subunit [Azospirillum sp. RWY-5-1]|uniref:Iron chelate uptake ABC transporter family permease subunit n=1 Tax=Azospirillum oleiclasticum TaxID=2735135 RepID=A0ABX2TJC8_9PROT|nr:iron chelate uptake ABC transporter family permease subunit [Azospirillum oleiclasticum]NYZ14553.1 iron chelate uptake ABC transporter family permease subunit [Azospirillum oleiclasticum]NYZ24331.1 iron chelate uptake ABC transporter family permease subunit [Azospirillum oleiclasticum]
MTRAGAAGVLVLVALCGASLATGVADLSAGGAESVDTLLISRLPRTLAVVLVGAGLAVAGLVMQTLARNRFVDPGIAGTEQSAALGILLATLLWPAAPLPATMLAATLAALAGSGVFLALAQRLPPTEPHLMPLFGLIYGGVITAGVTFVAWHMDLLQYLDIWLNGDFSGVLRGRYELLWAIAAMVGLAWWLADALTIASLGREVGTGLGLDYDRMLRLGLLIVAMVSALTVVVVGLIPFVGLIVPNLVSRLRGDNLRGTLPWVALGGAALTLACDVLGRVLRYPYEIPVGTTLGVVGAAGFLALLARELRHG